MCCKGNIAIPSLFIPIDIDDVFKERESIYNIGNSPRLVYSGHVQSFKLYIKKLLVCVAKEI